MDNTHEKIRILRRQRGLSQDELAAKMGITRQTISRWERGTVQPTKENLKLLSKTLQVELDYFTNGEEVTSMKRPIPVVCEKVAAVEEKRMTTKEKMELFFTERNASTIMVLAILSTLVSVIGLIADYCLTYFVFPKKPKSGFVVYAFTLDISIFILAVIATAVFIGLSIFLWITYHRLRNRVLTCRRTYNLIPKTYKPYTSSQTPDDKPTSPTNQIPTNQSTPNSSKTSTNQSTPKSSNSFKTPTNQSTPNSPNSQMNQSTPKSPNSFKTPTNQSTPNSPKSLNSPNSQTNHTPHKLSNGRSRTQRTPEDKSKS